MPCVSIEGLIGSGKTSFINYLKNTNLKAEYIDEPVEQFMNYKNFNPLAELKHNAFASQLHIIKSLGEHYKQYSDFAKRNQTQIIITERDLYSPFVFTDTLYRNKNISDFEKEMLYDAIFDMIKTTEFPETRAIFYMKAEPKDCLQRVEKRNRMGEKNNVDINYLNNLQISYNNQLMKWNKPLWSAHNDTNDMSSLFIEFKNFIKNV